MTARHPYHDADLPLLLWLLRFPFARVEDVALAAQLAPATTKDRLIRQEASGYVEHVAPPALVTSERRFLYHLSNRGILAGARHEHVAPAGLARRWQTDERGLQQQLAHLPDIVRVHMFIHALVQDTPQELMPIPRQPGGEWSWRREPTLRCTLPAGKRLVVAVDAYIELLLPPPRHVYAVLVLADRQVVDWGHVARRVDALYLWRASRLGDQSVDAFPPVGVIATGACHADHCQALVQRLAATHQCPPLIGGMVFDTEIADLWQVPLQLWSGRTQRLRDVLTPATASLMPQFSRSTPAQALPPSATRHRIISGNFTRRAAREAKHVAVHAPDAAQFWSLRLRGSLHTTLDTILQLPRLSGGELATILGVAPRSVERYSSELVRLGLVTRADQAGMTRFAVTHAGVLAVARRSALPRLQRATRAPVGRASHEAGIYQFCPAVHRAAQQRDGHALLWWETGPLCIKRYQAQGHGHNLRPDASGGYRAGQRPIRLWLEWDGGTMSTADLVEKFAAYAAYLASGQWQREQGRVLPLLLVVTPTRSQCDRLRRAATAQMTPSLLAAYPTFAASLTLSDRLEEQGPLAAIWWPLIARPDVPWQARTVFAASVQIG